MDITTAMILSGFCLLIGWLFGVFATLAMSSVADERTVSRGVWFHNETAYRITKIKPEDAL